MFISDNVAANFESGADTGFINTVFIDFVHREEPHLF